VSQLREAWDRFAAEEPLFYIEARMGRAASADELVEGGRAVVEWALDWIGDRLERARMLEIGCGIGRTAIHFGRSFERVDAVDVSPEMIRLASERDVPRNVHLAVSSGVDLSAFADATFDFVFSHLVFQHLPEESLVDGYLREIARVVRPGARALLQFDSRPRSLAAELLQRLPDPVLPRGRRRYIRRYRRDPARLTRLIEQAGLLVEDERGRGTEEHWTVLRRG
jgi:ubiquinone/menaquinone biosynthesis C-methylase UbiE